MSQAQIRSVTVRFDADIAAYLAKAELVRKATDDAVPDRRNITQANTALRETETRLDGVGRSATRTSSTVRTLGRDVDTTSRKFDQGGKSIDRYSGRLGVFLDLAVGLGPALIPIVAEAVPLTAALGANLGFIAAGGGTAVLALHGVGTALTAMNKYALDPTDSNLKALNLALDKLPPSAQRLVLELHRLTPEFEHLQRVAADEFLPGLGDGIRSAANDLPILEHGIHGISTELGDLARDAGKSLDSRQWRPFLRFVGREAPSALDDMARATGHIAHGVAGLVMSFDPLTDDVDQGILNLAKDFDKWATSVGRTQGFEDFLEYVRTNGPRILDLLGTTADTLIDVGTAVAPLGGPTIDILTHLLQVIDAIASSDLGTPLFGALVAFRLYARVAQLAGVQVETSFKGMAAAPRQMGTGLSELTEKTTRWSRTTIADIQAVTRAYATAGRASLTSPTRPLAMSQERLRSRLGTAFKGGAAAAGIALVASGAADEIGLTNSASLALAGSLAGPVGAAVGGAIGFTLDLAHANDDLTDSLNKARQAADGSSASIDFAGQQQSLDDLTGATRDYVGTLEDAWSPGGTHNPVELTKQGITAIGDLFSHSSSEAADAVVELRRNSENAKTAFGAIFEGLNGPGTGPGGESMVLTIQQLQQTANRAQPAMLALGISVDDLRDAADRGDGSLGTLTDRIVRYINRSDSASARTQGVANAIAAMGDETLTTDQRVQALSDSVDALLGPMLGLSGAADAYTHGLHSLAGELAKHNKTLKGNTEAALTNRGVIRDRVTELSNLIKAEAQAGESPAKMTENLKRQRKALIDAGVAAGLSRQDLEAYLDKLGLTPKLVKTTINLVGVDQSLNDLDQINRHLLGLRDRVIHVRVETTRLGDQTHRTTGGTVLAGASGGEIPGQRWPYGDKVLLLAAPGEHIITNRHGEADAFRRDRAAGRIPAYADGGTVGAFGAAQATPSPSAAQAGAYGPMSVTGVLDTPWGPATIEGIAEQAATRVVRAEKAANDRFEEARR